MKRSVLNLMRASGAFTPFRLANRAKTLILMYHRFCLDDGRGEEATPARAFAAHLDYLSAHYAIAPLSQVAEHLRVGEQVPPGTAAITIDDGYRDSYEIAFPILRLYNASATIFVVTDFIDQKSWLWTDKLRFLTLRTQKERIIATVGDGILELEVGNRQSRLKAAARVNSFLKTLPDAAKNETIKQLASVFGVTLPDLPPDEFGALTWDEARELDAAGIEIGSHTETHPILTNVGTEQLRRELGGSRSRLEAALGRNVDLFCYPNGNNDARVQREVERAGYRYAVSTDHGFNDGDSNPLALRRIPAEPDLAHFVQSTSGFELIKNRLRRGYTVA